MDSACIELHKQKVNACIKVTKIQSVILFLSFDQKGNLDVPCSSSRENYALIFSNLYPSLHIINSRPYCQISLGNFNNTQYFHIQCLLSKSVLVNLV